MQASRTAPGAKTKVVVITGDDALAEQVRSTFGASTKITLDVIKGGLTGAGDIDVTGASVVVADIDASDEAQLEALTRLMTRIGNWPPVVAVTQAFEETVTRRLMQMRVADFLVKPVTPVELVRTCARVAKAPGGADTTEAQIFNFLPAVGGAGVTTLAVQTAMLLLNSGARNKPSPCLVDLDFQHGACCDYLDIEPRLNLNEIEPRPERLDRQLLEVMISQHPSGLAVIAAPHPPAGERVVG